MNFKIKKAQTDEEKDPLKREKAEIKSKLRNLSTLEGLEADQIYK